MREKLKYSFNALLLSSSVKGISFGFQLVFRQHAGGFFAFEKL